MTSDQPAGSDTHPPMDGTTGVFICYRHDDKEAGVGRLLDRLVSRFGKTRVFRDIDRVLPTTDFVAEIDRALSRSGVLIAVIGPRWLTFTDDRGRRRIDDPDDYVRHEIEKALRSTSCQVLPVLRGGARMPGPKDLPKSLRGLAHLLAIEIDDDQGPHFDYDAQRVIDVVSSIIDSGPNLTVELADPDPSAEPGRSATSTVRVLNTGPSPAMIHLSVEGPPWATLPRDSGTVPAHGELTVPLSFRPPRASELPARRWPFRVVVRDINGAHPPHHADGGVATSSFRDTRVQLTPDRVETRREATFLLAVTNAGNGAIRADVSAAAHGLRIEAPKQVELGPGEGQEASIIARPRARRLVGRSSDHPLLVTVTVDEESEPLVRRAIVRVDPALRTGAVVVLLLVGVLVAGIGGVLLLRQASTEVLPDVTAMNGVEAVTQLRDAGFTDVTVTPEQSSAEPPGEVLRTEPGPGAKVPLDDAIRLVIAEAAPKKLPDVTDLTRDEALSTLAEAGFTKVTAASEPTTKEPAGEVLRTVPAAGTAMQPNAPVRVIVAAKPQVKLYTIPDVQGLTYEAAVKVLPEPLDILRKDEASDSVPAGLVIGTQPSSGTKHPAGTNVHVSVSTGPPTAHCVVAFDSGTLSCTGFKPNEQVALRYGAEPVETRAAGEDGAVEFDVSGLLAGSDPGDPYEFTATGEESGRTDTAAGQVP